MSKTQKVVWWLVSAVVVGLTVAVAEHAWREAKRVKTHVRSIQPGGGALVMAHLDCPVEQSEMNLASNGIRVIWPGHTAMVEKERVLLDGTEFAAIPAAATNIWLAITSGHFAVRADGVEVKSVPFAK